MGKKPTTLIEAVRYFGEKDRAFEWARDMRWPNGVICPMCGSEKHSFIKTRKTWQCKGCNKQFSVKKGTVMEDSPIPLDTWLVAIWLISNAKNGISSHEIGRSLGVTQKTAWFLLHRIRHVMENGTLEKLSGEVEADETFIGQKAANMHRSKRETKGYMDGGKGKTCVVGFVQRGGKIVCHVVKNREGSTIKPLISKHVERGSTLYTDLHGAYHGLYRDYTHGVVDHETAFVWGPIHTNGLENFWSLLKRSIRGTYAYVSPQHLKRYLNEYTFRYNERAGDDGARFAIVSQSLAGKRLTYKTLIGKA